MLLKSARGSKPCLKDIKCIFQMTKADFNFIHFWRNYKKNLFDLRDTIASIIKKKRHLTLLEFFSYLASDFWYHAFIIISAQIVSHWKIKQSNLP